jgi:hypothetical protein
MGSSSGGNDHDFSSIRQGWAKEQALTAIDLARPMSGGKNIESQPVGVGNPWANQIATKALVDLIGTVGSKTGC